MDKSLILNRLMSRYNLSTEADLARFLGVTSQALANWRSRNSLNFDIVLTKCERKDLAWVLTGEEEVLSSDNINNAVCTATHTDIGGIPLIPREAMAGYMSGDSGVVMEYECERYVVPMFKGAEFLIQVKGSSMIPKYSSGDVVACKKVSMGTFFQWNKVYVLNTEQGELIKRVMPGKSPQSLTLISDNERYPPFELALEYIYNIAIVIGVIRLE